MNRSISRAASLRRLTFVIGTSAAALSIATACPAWAQCAPDPTITNETTSCNGVDTDGLRVGTPNTTVTVETGASVSNTGSPAVLIDVPRSVSGYSAANMINVFGNVSAPGHTAIVVTSGAPLSPTGSTYQDVALAVGAGASVSGETAFALVQSPGNAIGTINATIDNAGTLTGTGGIALIGDVVTTSYGYTSPLTTFTSITNQAGGSIVGSIVGSAPLITNAGTIDGGTRSAIDSRLGFFSNITNAEGGVIRSASDAATILTGAANYYYASSSPINNSGTIKNAGSGAALYGNGLTIVNTAGGEISTGGSTAINASSINLVNQGLITGDVLASSGANTIDSAAGTINGSVTLGNDGNTLVARYVGSRTLATGIAGTLTVGGTGNVERLTFSADTRVNTPVDLDAGFQQLVLAPEAKVTTTLESSFSTAVPLVLSGQGTVVNRATLLVAAPGIRDLDYAFGTAASFVNEGVIKAALASLPYSPEYAVTLSNHSFTNTGTLTANGGGGINMSYNPVNNSGTIATSGTGAYVFDGVLTNTGTIISTEGDGAYLIGNEGYTGSNSGTIQGATSGVNAGVYLTNTGTISSAGVGVKVQPYAYLINGATGVVNGGSGGAVSVGSFNAGVANAGTINGNVNFSGSGSYIALSGGTLNGDLALGQGATLVTDLVNTGGGQFAGITGAVTAGDSATLRYAVAGDAAVTVPTTNVGPFSSVGYQLSDGATLTLTTPAGETRSQPLLLAGNGAVDLDTTIALTGAIAIQSTSAVTYPGAPMTAGSLSILNRGSVTLTRANSYSYSGAAFSLLASDSLINLGDISVTDRLGYNTAGIFGGTNVVNMGRITLDGGVGITGITDFGATNVITNSGMIVQRDGGLTANGVMNFAALVNDGTIAVGGDAVRFSVVNGATASLVNTGTLISTGGAAITDYTISYGTEKITNQASGTISGVGRAIQTAYASLTNAGTINGTVDLGYLSATSRSYTSAVYVAAGGTINGDLLFGSGSDLFLQTGETLGVSGIVDGGDGRNIYGQSRSASGSVAIDPTGLRNFQDVLVEAKGVGTVVTATGTFAGNLYAVGDGAIVNQASIGGALMANSPFSYGPVTFDQVSSLTNSGSVAGGVSGVLATFTNSGTIGSSNLAGAALYLTGDTLNIDNSGVIASAGALSPYFYSVSAYLNASTSITINNSGTIGDAGLYARTSPQPDVAGTLALTNSGTISSKTGLTAVDLEMGGFFGNSVGGAVSLTNAGMISSQGATTGSGGAVGVVLAAYGAGQPVALGVVNTGTISATAVQPLSGEADSAIAMEIVGNGAGVSTLSNALGGTIMASGPGPAIGLVVADTSLSLTNAGTIVAAGGTSSIAIQTFDNYANTIRNTGIITGDLRLAAGDDVVDNAGTITGTVTLGDGDDSYIQRNNGSVIGTVDGGTGINTVVLESTGVGRFSGATNFEKLAVNTGSWTLTSAQTYSGGTTIAVGASLTGTSATLTGNVADAGALIFNQATDGSVAVSLNGNGQLEKAGAGTLTIGSQTGFTGATLVNAGRLVLAGTLPSAVTVASGGTLAGSGTVANLAVGSGGTVAPGNSPGTIIVTGNFAQAAGSTYAAEVTATGVSDRIVVGGTATIAAGAVLSVTRDAGTYQIGQRYTLLTATGGIIGTYTLVQSPGGETELRLVRTINGIAVDLARTGASLATLAQTNNQAAVAGSFGTLDVTNAAYATLTLNPDDAAVRSALNSLSGEVHASLRTGMLKDAQAGQDAVRSRILSQSVGNGFWGQVNGLFGTDAATRDAAAVTRSGWGVIGGVDTAIGTHARAGLAGGYTHDSFTIEGRASRGTIKTKQVLGYAAGTLGPVALRASVGYAWADNTTTRRVAFDGYIATHGASYDGGVLHGMFEAGIKRSLLGGTVEPFTGIAAYRIRSDAFAETGATTALVGRAKSETFTLADLGLRADTPIVAGVSARTQIGWRRVIGDARPSATLQFAGADTPFTVAGAGLSRDSATMALDIEWKPVERLSIIAGYSGAIGGNGADDNRLRLTASLGF